MLGEDFETPTGLSLVSTKLERSCLKLFTLNHAYASQCATAGCMLKDHELPLSDVLQAKAGLRNADPGALAAQINLRSNSDRVTCAGLCHQGHG